jgi:hypothetical protein
MGGGRGGHWGHSHGMGGGVTVQVGALNPGEVGVGWGAVDVGVSHRW